MWEATCGEYPFVTQKPPSQDRTVSQIKSAIAINEDWQQKMNLLTSVPGIGERPRGFLIR